MKKLLAIIMAIVMMSSFVGCNNNANTPESSKISIEESTEVHEEETAEVSTEESVEVSDTTTDGQEKTPYEKVKDYLKTNGANYQGVYTIMHLGTTSFTISLYPDGYIYFYCIHEDENNSERETSTLMKLYEGSVTQPVTFEYIQQGYKIEANGTIYTGMFSDDFSTVFDVTYTENFPSSVSNAKIEEIVDALFGIQLQLMLAGVEAILVENVGVSLEDLGFTSW